MTHINTCVIVAIVTAFLAPAIVEAGGKTLEESPTEVAVGWEQAQLTTGGITVTERPQMKALRWLRDHQNQDGSWGKTPPSHLSALTGLSLLVFLAHGETPASMEFGACVLKAIRKCVEFAERDSAPVKEGDAQDSAYSRGIVACALAEAYAMTKIPTLGETVTKAIDAIIKDQSGLGAINDDNTPRTNGQAPRPDLSVLGWQCQALKAAAVAGCANDGLAAAIEQRVKVLQAAWSEPGQGGADAPGPTWFRYRNYYQTQAILAENEGKGPKWNDWNKLFSPALFKSQCEDGHWECPKTDDSGNPSELAILKSSDNPLYSTAMACLMLTVYYRYLPSFQFHQLTGGTRDAVPKPSIGPEQQPDKTPPPTPKSLPA